jgi:hypothetical protein
MALWACPAPTSCVPPLTLDPSLNDGNPFARTDAMRIVDVWFDNQDFYAGSNFTWAFRLEYCSAADPNECLQWSNVTHADMTALPTTVMSEYDSESNTVARYITTLNALQAGPFQYWPDDYIAWKVPLPKNLSNVHVAMSFPVEASHLGLCILDQPAPDPCGPVEFRFETKTHLHIYGRPPLPPSTPVPPSTPPSLPSPPLPPLPPRAPPWAPPPSSPLRVPVTHMENTAEEFGDGSVALYSSDLELMAEVDAGTVGAPMLQKVMVAFEAVELPPNAAVTAAALVFAVDELNPASLRGVNISVAGVRSANAPMPTSTPFDVSARPLTDATVLWSPPPSTTVGEELRTDDLAPIVREVVGLPGWVAGMPIAFVLEHSAGDGVRWVESWGYSQAGFVTPMLEVSWRFDAPAWPPAAPSDAPQAPPPPPASPPPAPRPPLTPQPVDEPPSHPPPAVPPPICRRYPCAYPVCFPPSCEGGNTVSDAPGSPTLLRASWLPQLSRSGGGGDGGMVVGETVDLRVGLEYTCCGGGSVGCSCNWTRLHTDNISSSQPGTGINGLTDSSYTRARQMRPGRLATCLAARWSSSLLARTY